MPKVWKFGGPGARKVAGALFSLSRDIKKDQHVATLKVASMILKDAKHFAPVRTGALRRSGRIEVNKEKVVTVAFGGKGTGVDYAPFVEFGRAPGKMPPVSEIQTWAARATGDANNAFTIARSIAISGVPAKPFLRPAVYKNRKHIRAIYGKHFKGSWTKAVRRSR